MEAYWNQYREHCLAQAAKSAAALDSLRRQQEALIEFSGNPVWIAALGKDIAVAQAAVNGFHAVLARLNEREQVTS